MTETNDNIMKNKGKAEIVFRLNLLNRNRLIEEKGW